MGALTDDLTLNPAVLYEINSRIEYLWFIH